MHFQTEFCFSIITLLTVLARQIKLRKVQLFKSGCRYQPDKSGLFKCTSTATNQSNSAVKMSLSWILSPFSLKIGSE